MGWKIRKGSDRGHFDHGWLKTWHSFSFSQYWDRHWMGYRSLRVINEDFVAPGEGFDPHPHDNMEIVTVILEGSLKHQDSMGNGSVIRPGDIQRMSAGTGVVHSEFNPSNAESVHLLQIWIHPEHEGIVPSYEQKHLGTQERRNRLLPVIVPADLKFRRGVTAGEAVQVHQDVVVYASVLEPGVKLNHSPALPRFFWLQTIRGSLRVNGLEIETGDAAFTDVATSDELEIQGQSESEFLLFELA